MHTLTYGRKHNENDNTVTQVWKDGVNSVVRIWTKGAVNVTSNSFLTENYNLCITFLNTTYLSLNISKQTPLKSYKIQTLCGKTTIIYKRSLNVISSRSVILHLGSRHHQGSRDHQEPTTRFSRGPWRATDCWKFYINNGKTEIILHYSFRLTRSDVYIPISNKIIMFMLSDLIFHLFLWDIKGWGRGELKVSTTILNVL